MLSEYSLSSLNIGLVTDDARLCIRSQQTAHTFVVLAFLKHIKRVSTFAIIWWLLMLRWIKELNQVLFFYPENLIALNSLFVKTELF